MADDHPIKIAGLKVPLMDEQRRHVYNIIQKMEEENQKQFVLCAICGGGKTLTALAIAKRSIHLNNQDKVLVVAPPPAIASWETDAKIHFEPVFRHVVLASTSEKNRKFFSCVNDCQLVILSYDTLCAAHKNAVQWRTTILKSEVQKLDSLFPRNANTTQMTEEEQQEYEDGRIRISQVHAFLIQHSKTEDMSIDIPFPDLYEKERDKSLRPMLFDNLYMTKFKWLFADEAHEARNNKSVKFASLRDIRREYSMAISATICNNSAEDYISILKIIGVNPEQGWISLRRNKDACAEFMNNCSTNMIIASSKEIRNKITESYSTKTILLRPHKFVHQEEIDAYEQVRNEWNAGDGLSKQSCRDTILRVIMALRQCCDFANTQDPNKGVMVTLEDGVRHRVVSTKLEMVRDYICNYVLPKKEKVIVFCWFKNAIHVLKAMLPHRLRVEVITGSVSHKKRRSILESFERQLSSAVLIATPGTTSLGVNIPCANHCILVNNWWNPVVSEQALCRNRRPGQRRSLRWVQAMIPNTVEDSIKLVADFKVELDDHMRAGKLTASMLDSITSNKAIQQATSSSESSKRKLKKKASIDNTPSNILLPIVNQDISAIMKMRSFCQQPLPSDETIPRRILPASFYSSASTSSSSSSIMPVTYGGNFPTSPEMRMGDAHFLNPKLEQAEQLIHASYDHIVRTIEDFQYLPETHSIDLSHVPSARENSLRTSLPMGMQPISNFAQARKDDERKMAQRRQRALDRLPEDQKGFRKFLSTKEMKEFRDARDGKQKRTIKMISISDIAAIGASSVPKKQCRAPPSSSLSTTQSISSSLQKLQSISSVSINNTHLSHFHSY